jgi:diguanylate cyclase (GGDEF)-like protein
VDRRTKADVAEIIHSQTFENDGYMWVNEIVNWEGGDNYAIRRIHPNLRNTEGSFLSTNTKDVKGNAPYLAELEGVKKSGELYSTYFFKRKGSDAIAEKLSYAALYKDYSWIVAMGVYLEDVQVYIDAAEEAGRSLTARVIALVFALMVLFFSAALYVLSRLESWYLRRTSRASREESNTDHLTGALNRRIGETYIDELFKRYHRALDDPVFFFFDVDNFKKVNDAYGHDAGDKVLAAIASNIRQDMRSTDHIIRWGGEEFLLICYGVPRKAEAVLAAKFNKVIAGLPIVIGTTDGEPTCRSDLETCAYLACEMEDRFIRSCVNRNGDRIIHVSISIGISRFDKTDSSPLDAVKRADAAMYEAKAAGKNRACSGC